MRMQRMCLWSQAARSCAGGKSNMYVGYSRAMNPRAVGSAAILKVQFACATVLGTSEIQFACQLYFASLDNSTIASHASSHFVDYT